MPVLSAACEEEGGGFHCELAVEVSPLREVFRPDVAVAKERVAVGAGEAMQKLPRSATAWPKLEGPQLGGWKLDWG